MTWKMFVESGQINGRRVLISAAKKNGVGGAGLLLLQYKRVQDINSVVIVLLCRICHAP